MAANHVRRETASTRAFRVLLALYPAAFRDEYHRELMLVFLDRYRYSTSRWDRARLWLEASTGILAEAPKEHARMVLQDLRYALRVLRQRPFVTATIVTAAYAASPAFRSLMNRYQSFVSLQVVQSAACHAFHGVEARLCRWLLQARDVAQRTPLI